MLRAVSKFGYGMLPVSLFVLVLYFLTGFAAERPSFETVVEDSAAYWEIQSSDYAGYAFEFKPNGDLIVHGPYEIAIGTWRKGTKGISLSFEADQPALEALEGTWSWQYVQPNQMKWARKNANMYIWEASDLTPVQP